MNISKPSTHKIFRLTVFLIISIAILIKCTTEAFEDEGTAPEVLYSLGVSAGDGGNVSSTGGSFKSGSTVTITATPDSEYIFVGWTGTSSTGNPLTLTVNSNQQISAVFEKKKYQLTVNINGEGSVEQSLIDAGKSTDYDSGSIIELTASPDSDHAFFYWNNQNVVDTINPIQITIDGNKSIDVNFNFQNARDLVGEWEFDLQNEGTAKSNNKILMSIDLQLNILFTLILNNITTQIFSQLNALNNNTFAMGSFGVLTNVSFSSSSNSGLSLNVVILPVNASAPTSENNIPNPTPSNSLTLSGNKTSNSTAPIVPPATATTSATTPSQTASSTNVLSNLVSQVNAVSESTSQTTISDLTGDNDPPLLELQGDLQINLTVGDTFIDPGAIAVDVVDGNLTDQIQVTGSVNTSSEGSYILNYIVSDISSNVASATRLVIVSAASTSITSTSIYFENGTCKCPDASVGDTATISGTLYTVVDNDSIKTEIANGNVNLCTTLVTDMSELFSGNDSFNSEIGFWDSSSVTNMKKMFNQATSFNQDISNWDTSSVTNMEEMFAWTSFNKDISGWDVSNVESFYRTFAYTTAFNQPIGSWDMSSATTISGMFRGSNEQNKTVFDQNINSWDTSDIVVMSEVFAYANFNQNIGNWDVSSVRLLTAMFTYNPNFNQDIGGWDLSSMTDANNLIDGSNYGDA